MKQLSKSLSFKIFFITKNEIVLKKNNIKKMYFSHLKWGFLNH